MWTVQNVMTLVVAIAGPLVAVGVFLQRLNHLTKEVAQLQEAIQQLKDSRYRQGKRLGRVEGWISASDGISAGHPPPLHSSRHDTRGVPVIAPKQDSGSDEEPEETGNG